MRITRDQYTCVMNKDVKPAAYCDVPATVTFETQDCFFGTIKSEEDTVDSLDYDNLNPSTGPVFFNGVKPGDVLEVKVKRIKCDSPGATMCVPNEGLLGDLVEKSITKIYSFEDNKVSIGNIELELEPMIGVIGLAPKEGSIGTVLPGDHGGNMDTTLIREGATLYLPVFVEGGLLALGDLHAAMGDGESFYTGLEVSGEVELEINVRKDLKMDIPFVKAGDKFASIATEKDVAGALKKSMEKLVKFVTDNGEMDFYDAGFICGLYANLEISQVVDPLKTARMSIKLDILDKLGIVV